MSVRLLSFIIASGCAAVAVTACSSPSVPEEADLEKTTQASSVTIQMFDKSGNELGSCSGTLVSKDLVLTAGHCAAGVATWKIDSRGADMKSTATRAVTPWKAFGSNLAHPDHSDVALLVLKTPIELDKYPGIATSPMSAGTRALEFSRSSAAASTAGSSIIKVSSGRAKGFRLNYVANVDGDAFLDTGGAIVDPQTGKIHGVVSGKGGTSGLLHIARTDNFAKWISKAGSCGESGSGVSPRDYSSSSSGGSSSYGGSSGDWGGYGGSSGSGKTKLDAAAPPPYGGDGGGSSGTSGTSGKEDGGSAGKDGGASGTPGDGTDTPGGNGGSTCPGAPTCEGSACPGKDGPGTPGSMTPPGGDTPGDSTGTPGGSTSSSSSGGNKPGSSDEVCPGPPGCPVPDSQTCVGADCGGCGGVAGCADSTIDYGSCGSCGSGSGTGGSPVLR